MSALSNAAAGIAQRLRGMADRPQSVTINDLINRYMLAYAGRDTTLPQRLDTWKVLVGDFTLENVDSDLIHAARNELRTLPALSFKGVDHLGNKIFKPKTRHRAKSPATINRYISAISSIFTWAIEERLTPRGWAHPCRGIKLMPESPGRIRFLDDAERERLFTACKESRYPRMYALVLTAIVTGARKGELLSLTWRDVDLDAAVARLGRTKNGERRTLVLLPQVVLALRPFVSSDHDRYVFGATKTKQRTPAAIETAWAHVLVRAEIKNYKFHDNRHTCASYLAQNGVALNVIANILGHKRLEMAMRYSHMTTDTTAAAMQAALGKIGAKE